MVVLLFKAVVLNIICCAQLYATPHFLCGADQLTHLHSILKPQTPLGILTNQTGITSNGKRTIDALLTQGFALKKIFAPEHGISGKVGAELKISDEKDEASGLPVLSLYKGDGPNAATDMAARFSDIDALLIDLQDSGMRHYTYISMMYKALEVAQKHNKTVIILDRPNPLGSVMEGPLVDPNLISFISIAPVPIRHSMTMGELALYCNKQVLSSPVDLHVVPLAHYQRPIKHTIALPLSPNLKTMQSVYGYSFLGMLGEVAPFYVGVGTPDAFRCIMLSESYRVSEKQWIALSLGLKKLGITTVAHKYYHEGRNKTYVGLRVFVPHINKVPSLQTFLYVTDFFRARGVELSFAVNFDKAAGTPLIRQYLQGSIERSKLLAILNTQAKEFYSKVQPYLLYEPKPKLHLLA
jgi:uncharacterized protein YbbC (DUF1343 family)